MKNPRLQGIRELPSQSDLMTLFEYNPETGELKRRQTGNVIKARGRTGHLQAGIGGSAWYAHRIIWKMMTGEDPKGEIDHIDCDPGNNRWANLRAADRSQNSANRGRNKNNTSGFKGVRLHAGGRWAARVTVDWKEIHLGLFDTPEEAHEAYKIAAAWHRGEFARAA